MNKQFKRILIATLSLTAFIGTYNALIISSESGINGLSNVKRLDEMYGTVKIGRKVAVAGRWEKLSNSALNQANEIKVVNKTQLPSDTTSSISEAFTQETLELKLSEVINPKKWTKPIKANDFSGNITANNGVIENLTISLPNTEAISASFSEMSGNVFEYEFEGKMFSGLMYQVDQSAYVVTLTNGPLEGTRLRFESKNKQNENQEFLAQNHNVEVGNFGEENQEEVTQAQNSNPVMNSSTFNFNSKI